MYVQLRCGPGCPTTAAASSGPLYLSSAAGEEAPDDGFDNCNGVTEINVDGVLTSCNTGGNTVYLEGLDYVTV